MERRARWNRVAVCVAVGISALALAMLLVLLVSFHASNKRYVQEEITDQDKADRLEGVLRKISPTDTTELHVRPESIEIKKSSRDERRYKWVRRERASRRLWALRTSLLQVY